MGAPVVSGRGRRGAGVGHVGYGSSEGSRGEDREIDMIFFDRVNGRKREMKGEGNFLGINFVLTLASTEVPRALPMAGMSCTCPLSCGA